MNKNQFPVLPPRKTNSSCKKLKPYHRKEETKKWATWTEIKNPIQKVRAQGCRCTLLQKAG